MPNPSCETTVQRRAGMPRGGERDVDLPLLRSTPTPTVDWKEPSEMTQLRHDSWQQAGSEAFKNRRHSLLILRDDDQNRYRLYVSGEIIGVESASIVLEAIDFLERPN